MEKKGGKITCGRIPSYVNMTQQNRKQGHCAAAMETSYKASLLPSELIMCSGHNIWLFGAEHIASMLFTPTEINLKSPSRQITASNRQCVHEKTPENVIADWMTKEMLYTSAYLELLFDEK